MKWGKKKTPKTARQEAQSTRTALITVADWKPATPSQNTRGAAEMAQWLRALVLAKDLGLVLSPHMAVHNHLNCGYKGI